MRGGFVACIGIGETPGAVERAAEMLRWHRGRPERFHGDRIELALYVDAADGPLVETAGGSTRLVHGAALAPLADLQRTAGRFAAIEWDGSSLRASRDPLGLAPLFYRVLPDAIWLATEITPLLKLGGTPADTEALSARAAFAPMDERTGWQGILRILPGCTFEFRPPDWRAHIVRYWHPERLLGSFRGSYPEALDEFRSRFTLAVKRCVAPRSAILLSGGLDSAAVAVTTRAQAGVTPHLVHVHFPGLPATHEQRYAAAVAAAVGAPLSMVSGQATPWDIGAELDLHGIPYDWRPYGMDEPALSHIAGQGIAVALDGHDGDGVLGPPGGGVWGELVLKGELRRLTEYFRRYGPRRALRGLAGDFLPPAMRPRRYRSDSDLERVARYFRDPLKSRIGRDDIYRWRWPSRRWRVRQLLPLLPRAVISFEQKEIEAARFGIDLQHPFADRHLVEFLVALPCALKSDPGRLKPVLLDAFGSDLPPELHTRVKSDYMAAVRHRVDPAHCLEVIRASKVRLPHVDYERLLADGDVDAARIPLFLLINLARVHEFARRVR
jgi:hypothetical protein